MLRYLVREAFLQGNKQAKDFTKNPPAALLQDLPCPLYQAYVWANHPREFTRTLLPARSVNSETGRIRFRRVWFQTPSSVTFKLSLTEFRGGSSVSSSQRVICVCKSELTAFFAELTEFAQKTQWVLSSETAHSKQHSAGGCFLKFLLIVC